MFRKIWFLGFILALVVLSLANCTPGPNALSGSMSPDGTIAGFWLGLWHGIIAPISFIISIFSDKVNVYEVYNSGNWYNFGFMLGLSISLGSSASSAGRGKKKTVVREIHS